MADFSMRSTNWIAKLPGRARLGSALVWGAIFSLAYMIMLFLPTPGADFHASDRPFIDYPPWITLLVLPVRSIAVANALTLTALAYALWRRDAKPMHYVLAFTAMPLYWNLWLSQYEFIPLLGLVWLPWGLPLALTKPQVAVWGVGAWWLQQPRKWQIATAVVIGVLVSFLVYGWWPANLQRPTTIDTVYNLSAWYWGGPVLGGLAVVAAIWATLKTRDMDRAMALGALAAPYIQGHGYLLLIPAFARLKGVPLILVWLASWVSLVTLVLGDAGRVCTLAFPLAVWAALTWDARARAAQGAT